MTTAAAFAEKVQVHPSGCWYWTGSVNPVTGYGQMKVAGSVTGSHRVAYELHVGPIPTGLEIDHLCRVRRCVNPAHLEPVTRAENMRRARAATAATECTNGHPYTSATTYVRPRGGRTCRTCKNANARQSYRSHKETAA